ncbi:MAG TPA: hypothetical protein VFB38_09555 [Chthonomonadaceae bacterium]|nr:hypothetical protein [Chthonomonadaceae bacterium]
MPLTIDLTPEEEARLKALAQAEGVDVAEYVRRQLLTSAPKRPMTPAEMLDYWQQIGVLGAWADREDIGDTEEFAEELRRQANTRDWE